MTVSEVLKASKQECHLQQVLAGKEKPVEDMAICCLHSSNVTKLKILDTHPTKKREKKNHSFSRRKRSSLPYIKDKRCTDLYFSSNVLLPFRPDLGIPALEMTVFQGLTPCEMQLFNNVWLSLVLAKWTSYSGCLVDRWHTSWDT